MVVPCHIHHLFGEKGVCSSLPHIRSMDHIKGKTATDKLFSLEGDFGCVGELDSSPGLLDDGVIRKNLVLALVFAKRTSKKKLDIKEHRVCSRSY